MQYIKNNIYQAAWIKFLPLFFVVFFVAYYVLIPYEIDINTVYISMSIFLFATLTGFFISTQGKRYSNIVSKIADFDGNMSYLYRSSSVFGKKAQGDMKEILQEHYNTILTYDTWEGYLSHKSNTLTKINELVNTLASRTDLNSAEGAFASRAYFALGAMQQIRKHLIILYQSKIPSFQWYILDFLAFVVILIVAILPSGGVLQAILVKAAFSTVIAAILFLIRRINNLSLFEKMAGAFSAQDVLNIIEGKS